MRNFYKGMDISSLPECMDLNETLYDASGIARDPFELLEANHVNSIRIRIWNDPSNFPEAHGYCDLAHTLQIAQKIKEHHMHFVLDFHYSDYWADPGQQRIPKAWEQDSLDELIQHVFDYTAEVLSALAKQDTLPDMVQIGNEIRSGLLFPYGAVPNYTNIAHLLNAGIRACRKASPATQVMIHLDQGGRFYYLKEWFDAVFAAGLLPIDAIGISFYSFWHGTFMDLRDSMTQLIATYHLPVYVVETAHPWRICEEGHVSEDLMKTAGLSAGIQNQRTSLKLIMQIAALVSKDLDTGVYYWEPLGVGGYSHGSWDENMTMMDHKGQVLPSFEIYRDFDPDHIFAIDKEDSSLPQNADDLDTYMKLLYVPDEDSRITNGTNLVSNSDFSDGNFANGSNGFWLWTDIDDVNVTVSNHEVFVSSKQNFQLQLEQDIQINTPGLYVLSLDYRGTNTTGVDISLFLKTITCNGENEYVKSIFPSDVCYVTHCTDPIELSVGQVKVGIRMNTPPIDGRFTNLRLIKIDN